MNMNMHNNRLRALRIEIRVERMVEGYTGIIPFLCSLFLDGSRNYQDTHYTRLLTDCEGDDHGSHRPPLNNHGFARTLS